MYAVRQAENESDKRRKMLAVNPYDGEEVDATGRSFTHFALYFQRNILRFIANHLWLMLRFPGL